MAKRLAIVTGANKGIGYACVQALCKQFDGDVFLTGRSAERCQAAVAELQKEGLSPKWHLLDVDDQTSIDNLRDYIKENYGGIDVLINNAGLLIRVVNVSSFTSIMALSKCSDEIKSKFTRPDITMDQLKALMQQFIEAAQTGDHEKQGFANWSYAMSKVGVAVMSFIQQRQFNSDPREDIIVNACCPGYVDTDMTSHKGQKTIQQGADTPVYLALLPPGTKSPKGNFVSDRTVKKWG